jgi:glutamyl-tRNA reductase
MYLGLTGINHRTAPVAIREKVAVSTEKLPGALVRLRRYLPHGLILSTCNRTEIYLAGLQDHDLTRACTDFFQEISLLPTDKIAPYLYSLKDRAMVEHLCEVSCGLDSMVIGEYEILGQVGQALEGAEKAGMVNLPLRHLFQGAIRTGRRVREETGISKNALSVSSIAVNKALDIIPDISNAKIVILGAGEAGKLAVKVVKSRGASKISVMSRTEERAVCLTSQYGGRPAAFNRLAQELCDADLVIACATSPHPVLHYQQVKGAMSNRPELPMIIIDIAVPRNAETTIQEITNVHLYNLDDLNVVADGHRLQREAEIASVIKIVAEEVNILMKWWQAHSVRPVIKSLVNRADRIRTAQYNRAIKKLSSLTKEEKASVDLLTRSIVDKILRDPIMYLKSGDGRDAEEVISRLFNLEDGTEP